MSNDSRASIERGLALFGALVEEHPALRREFEKSRAEFRTGGRGPGDEEGDEARGPSEARRLADRRHLEWFLLERFSEHLEGAPAEALREDWEGRVDEEHRAALGACLGSRAGVYEVTGVAAGSGLWVRDLLTRGEYPVEEPEAAAGLVAGDLVVGRLYPLGNETYSVSPAAGCFRSEGLRGALTRDLEAARSARRGTPRISQLKLEQMFFAGADEAPGAISGAQPTAEAAPDASDASDAPDAPDLLEAAGAWLEAAGVDAGRARSIVASLVASPLTADRALPGVDDPLAQALEELAFDSDADLAEARRVLLSAWTVASEGRDARGPSPTPTDAARPPAAPAARQVSEPIGIQGALTEFDRARTAGGDLTALFDQLELSLGLEPDGAEERFSTQVDPGAETDGSPAPDFPGVMGAMVEEFLWDAERGGAADERQGILRLFGPYAEQVSGLGVFENLTARDLVLFLSSWVIERGAVRQGAEARALVDAAQAFCVWADEHHELDLAEGFEHAADSLRSSLPRLVEANLALGEARPGAGDSLMGELSVERGEVLVDAGGDRRRLELPLTAISHLRTGDLAKVRERAGSWEPERFFPAQAAEFLRS